MFLDCFPPPPVHTRDMSERNAALFFLGSWVIPIQAPEAPYLSTGAVMLSAGRYCYLTLCYHVVSKKNTTVYISISADYLQYTAARASCKGKRQGNRMFSYSLLVWQAA